jgi:pimeloyl-ACP methyl ester carboxylesterase
VVPLEYPLIDAGFRLLVVHRPGYAGTALEGAVEGRKVDWRSPGGFARTAAGLLDHLYGAGKWRLSVIGTSGGAPTALAFADLYPEQTMALVIQAGVTHPWTDARFVPELFRNSYQTAFRQFGWAGDHVSQIIFGLLAKFRENFIGDEDKLRALIGSRLEEARRDPAFDTVVSTILREDPANRRGEFNDVFNVFFAKTTYYRYGAIKARTLILHDPEDTFVPFVHAERAAETVPNALLRSFHLAGHHHRLHRPYLAQAVALRCFPKRLAAPPSASCAPMPACPPGPFASICWAPPGRETSPRGRSHGAAFPLARSVRDLTTKNYLPRPQSAGRQHLQLRAVRQCLPPLCAARDRLPGGPAGCLGRDAGSPVLAHHSNLPTPKAASTVII